MNFWRDDNCVAIVPILRKKSFWSSKLSLHAQQKGSKSLMSVSGCGFLLMKPSEHFFLVSLFLCLQGDCRRIIESQLSVSLNCSIMVSSVWMAACCYGTNVTLMLWHLFGNYYIHVGDELKKADWDKTIINWMPWHSQSPSLNPAEHFMGDFGGGCARQDSPQPSLKHQLMGPVLEEWFLSI